MDIEDNNKGEEEVEDNNVEEPLEPLEPLVVVRFISI